MTPTTQSSTEAALAAVKEIIEPWNRACLERDWDALLDMCTPDIVFLPFGEPPVRGAAVRPWLDAFPPILEMAWDVTSIEANDDLAFVWGPVRQTLEVDGKRQPLDAKYSDLLRREADGTWRFAVIAWSPNSA